MSHVKPLQSIPFELQYTLKQQLNLQLFIELIAGSIKAHQHIMVGKRYPHIVYRQVVETPEQLMIRGSIYYHPDEEVPNYIERYLDGASYPVLHLDNNTVLGVKF